MKNTSSRIKCDKGAKKEQAKKQYLCYHIIIDIVIYNSIFPYSSYKGIKI